MFLTWYLRSSTHTFHKQEQKLFHEFFALNFQQQGKVSWSNKTKNNKYQEKMLTTTLHRKILQKRMKQSNSWNCLNEIYFQLHNVILKWMFIFPFFSVCLSVCLYLHIQNFILSVTWRNNDIEYTTEQLKNSFKFLIFYFYSELSRWMLNKSQSFKFYSVADSVYC